MRKILAALLVLVLGCNQQPPVGADIAKAKLKVGDHITTVAGKFDGVVISGPHRGSQGLYYYVHMPLVQRQENGAIVTEFKRVDFWEFELRLVEE